MSCSKALCSSAASGDMREVSRAPSTTSNARHDTASQRLRVHGGIYVSFLGGLSTSALSAGTAVRGRAGRSARAKQGYNGQERQGRGIENGNYFNEDRCPLGLLFLR